MSRPGGVLWPRVADARSPHRARLHRRLHAAGARDNRRASSRSAGSPTNADTSHAPLNVGWRARLRQQRLRHAAQGLRRVSQPNIFDSETPLPDEALARRKRRCSASTRATHGSAISFGFCLNLGELGAWNKKHHGGKLAALRSRRRAISAGHLSRRRRHRARRRPPNAWPTGWWPRRAARIRSCSSSATACAAAARSVRWGR